MANLGGGAEVRARFEQYEYRALSSLVLAADSRPRFTHEPADGLFGDRAAQNKPPELEEKLAKSRNKKNNKRLGEADPDLPRRDAKRSRRVPSQQDAGVLSLTDDVVYKPQTKETHAAYEALLSIIQQQLGGQPLDVLGGAADEVLATLKNDKNKNRDKKDIEKLLNTVPNQAFDQLVPMGKLITDCRCAFW